jgi:hypothetical protein
MWSSWVRRKGTTQVMYIAKLNDGPKRVTKLSQWFGKGFRNGMMEGEKMKSYKKGFWSWSVFLLSKYWLPLLFEEILVAFLSLFFNTFSSYFSLSLSLFLCSISWGLGGSDDIRGEKSLF